MPESTTTLSFSATPTALLAAPTMVPMPASTPTPTLEPHDEQVAVGIIIAVSAAILLLICLACAVCCYYLIKLCIRRRSLIDRRRQDHQQKYAGPSAVNETSPPLASQERRSLDSASDQGQSAVNETSPLLASRKRSSASDHGHSAVNETSPLLASRERRSLYSASDQGGPSNQAPTIQGRQDPQRDGRTVPRTYSANTLLVTGTGQLSTGKKMEKQSTSAERNRAAAAETELKRLCLIPSGIDQLTIHPRGGNVILGNGDATLVAEMGAVGKETVVRYAVILNGPFVYSDGYTPASVVVYLNLEGATLLKPVKLMLDHWCKNPMINGEAVLRQLRAPHTTSGTQDCYTFEVEGVSSSSSSNFTISESQGLYSTEMAKETPARYNAIAFQKDSLDSVEFKIQFMYDSLKWNEYLTNTLERKGWKNNSKGNVARFSFVDSQITATPPELHGPGWEAAIHGHQAVRAEDFLQIQGKAKDAVDAEVQSERYPPCLYYQVVYTSGADQRPAPASWRAELCGADVKLSFSCNVKQEPVLRDELSPKKGERDVTTAATLESQAEKVLDTFRKRFIAEMDADTVVHELKHQEIIPPGVAANISMNRDPKQQNEILWDSFKERCTEEALITACDIMIAVRGNSKLNDLGKDMKEALEEVTDGPGLPDSPAKKAKVQGAEAPADGQP